MGWLHGWPPKVMVERATQLAYLAGEVPVAQRVDPDVYSAARPLGDARGAPNMTISTSHEAAVDGESTGTPPRLGWRPRTALIARYNIDRSLGGATPCFRPTRRKPAHDRRCRRTLQGRARSRGPTPRPGSPRLCVGRGVASDIFSLLRGRYGFVRALVPTALSIMSLIALACEKAIMLDTAVVGAADMAGQPQISSTEAADWLARNCRNPDVEDI